MKGCVDPAVCRRKFNQELADYRKLEDEHLKRGWWMLKAEFPEVFVVFATDKVNPPGIVFGVLLDFTDYDFRPPSVRFVHPFSLIPYKHREMPTKFPRSIPLPPEAAGGPVNFAQQELIAAHGPEDIPFLCISGVREYHDHPAHSGDFWELHRGTGVGTMYFLLDQIHKYGVEPFNSYNFQISMSVRINGFLQPQAPQ